MRVCMRVCTYNIYVRLLFFSGRCAVWPFAAGVPEPRRRAGSDPRQQLPGAVQGVHGPALLPPGQVRPLPLPPYATQDNTPRATNFGADYLQSMP